MKMNYRLLSILVLGSAVAMGEAPSWSHNPAAENGPMHWGGVAAPFATCGQQPAGSASFVEVGMKQTPINIEKDKAVATALPPIDFAYKSMPLEVENTGHVVEVVYQPGSSIRLGKSATDTYNLVQFHFHAPSEHTVDGKQYDGEMHLVHANVLGDLLVVGVLLSKAPDAPHGVFDEIAAAAPMSVGVTKKEEVSLNASSLLPAERGFFSYTGSLTTPPCTESVRWFVMRSAVPVSEAVIEHLHAVAAHFPSQKGFADNNRPVTPLNGRTVLMSH